MDGWVDRPLITDSLYKGGRVVERGVYREAGTYTHSLLLSRVGETNTGVYLEVAAEAVSLLVAMVILVQLDLVLLSDGVSHDNATLGHELHKLLCGDVWRQAWRDTSRESP